ncbi:MAG: hypothetical protein U9Q03_03975 [Patescibacteria group bacterium]|nr:hypothetical protein [Patescibacteria group bacterium]
MSKRTKSPDGDTLSPEVLQDLERHAEELLAIFDPGSDRKAKWRRPFTIEYCGVPASGKTTAQGITRHFFRRDGFVVHAPQEGAEAIEGPRPLPGYNLHTAEWAIIHARALPGDKRFHVGVFDRAIYDGITRMEYYLAEGIISEEERAIIEGYYLLPYTAGLFDMHVFLICSPDTTLARKREVELLQKPGKTLNTTALNKLHAAHRRVWERLGLEEKPNFLWLDTDDLTRREVTERILDTALDLFRQRLKREGM